MKRTLAVAALLAAGLSTAEPYSVTSANEYANKMAEQEEIKTYDGFLEQLHRKCLQSGTNNRSFTATQTIQSCNRLLIKLKTSTQWTPGELLYFLTMIQKSSGQGKEIEDEAMGIILETILNK